VVDDNEFDIIIRHLNKVRRAVFFVLKRWFKAQGYEVNKEKLKGCVGRLHATIRGEKAHTVTIYMQDVARVDDPRLPEMMVGIGFSMPMGNLKMADLPIAYETFPNPVEDPDIARKIIGHIINQTKPTEGSNGNLDTQGSNG
jgi:hypothetical protein